mgnify:CR=1 FL=1
MKKVIKYIHIPLTILLLAKFGYGGVLSVQGKVIDKNQKAVQYASIGIINKNIGTVSDNNGEFILILDNEQLSESDTLRISMIGYESKSFSLSEIINPQNLIIQLNLKIEAIPEVIITRKKVKRKVKGSTHFPVPLYVLLTDSTKPDQNLGSAIARSFNINHTNTVIEKLRFYLYTDFDTTTIRVNIYNVKKRKPHKSILEKGIYTRIIGKKHDWISINLRQSNIIVSDDVIIAIEWIGKSNNGNYLFFPLARPSLASHFYKQGCQNNWDRYPGMSCLMEIELKY